MFDKLKLTSSKEVNTKNLHNIINDSLCSFQRVPDKHYKSCFSVRRGGKQIIAVKSNPIMTHISSIAIEVNPSHFKSYNDLTVLLEKIAPIESYQIKRIDHCVDLNIPIEQIYSQLMVKRKSKRSDFMAKDKLTGFTIGKIPEVICGYNKDIESIKRKRVIVKSGVTRVEVRHYKNKIDVCKVNELYKYAELNPFKSLCFLTPKDTNDLQTRFRDKSVILRELCSNHGLQSAYKSLNNKSNFNRSFSRYFENSEINNLLLTNYQNNIKNFMEVNNE